MEPLFFSSVYQLHSSSLSRPFFLPSSALGSLYSKKLSSNFSPNFPSFRRFPCLLPRQNPHRFAVSASSVAVKAEKDKFPAEVRVTETEQPRSSVRLSVEVPPAVCQECYKKVLDAYSKQIKIPGFRPGKRIPENILINYVGKQNVQHATIEAILKRTLPHAMSSVEGRALKDSVRIVTKFSEMNNVFSLQDILRYDVVVDVTPDIKWLSENKYKNLKVVVEIDNSINAQRASEIEFRRRYKSLGSLRIVADRGLQVQEAILQRCREVEQTAIEQATDNAILDQLCKIVEVDVPQSLFEEQGRQLYGTNLLQLQARNKLSEQQLASLSSEKAVKTYLENQRDNITNIVKQMLAVSEIFKCEHLELPTEELVKEVQNSVAEFKRHNQEYEEERVREQVQDVLEGAKVLEWLRESSQIEYVVR